MESITEMLADPEKVKEAMADLENPEAMEEVRAMMEDPEFRRQVQEAVAAGGDGSLESLQEVFGATELSGAMGALGPPLGAALDALKTSVLDAGEYSAALQTLTALLGKLQHSPDEPKFRSLRLSNEALQQRLLQHEGGRVALKALGFTQEVERDGEAWLELPEELEGVPSTATRHMQLLGDAKAELENAQRISAEFDLPFSLSLQLPNLRSTCAGDPELAGNLTKLILENAEFRAQINGPMGELALPPMLQLLRSKEGAHGLLEYFEGAPPPGGTKVLSVSSVSEWKEALLAAGDAPLAALFWSPADFGSRVLRPIFARLPEVEELSGCSFVSVELDLAADDGLAMQVLDEAFVSPKALPSCLFFGECTELRKWRYEGADVAELLKRLHRVIKADRLEEGPEETVH